MSRRRIAVLGGSFDPVHAAHVALARHFAGLLKVDELRVIPAGSPWQKGRLQADARQRLAMLELAFADFPVPVVIDRQEIERETASYAIDTVKNLRAELGEDTAIAFLIGADQLQRLDTWKSWRSLFDHVHFCVASRPGWTIDASGLPPEVALEVEKRHATAAQLCSTAYGTVLLSPALALDMSSTGVREALAGRDERDTGGNPLNAWVPPTVLDYIRQQHLYGS